MKGAAILEVLLVCAEGIGHTSILGHPGYHVIVECGTQMCRSKTSSGSLDKIYWNEKFIFEFPASELETWNHIKLKIVNEKYFTGGEFVGETLIFIKGIIVEGNRIGLIELNPAPFNVVIQDRHLQRADNNWIEIHSKYCFAYEKKRKRAGGKRYRQISVHDYYESLENAVVEAFIHF